MKVIRPIAWFLIIVVVSLTFTVLSSPARYEVAGIKTRISAFPRVGGGSVVALYPLGEIKARTHTLPMALNIDIEGVNQAVLEDLLDESKTGDDYLQVVERDARSVALSYALRLLLLAAIGGLVGCLLLTRKWRPVVAAPFIGMACIGVLFLGVYAQFDPTAFTHPQITGPLASVPFLVSSIENKTNPLDILQQDIVSAAKNLRSFAAKIESWQPIEPEKGAAKILVVSDIHNNPTGFSLVQKVARDFQVDFIIDAGDITDFGTPLEASLLSRFRKNNIPYLYTPGNHDTSAVLSELAGLPDVTILDKRLVQEKDIYIYGAGDPVSKTAQFEPLSDKDMVKWASRLQKDVDSLSPQPLILVVHDKRMAEKVIGDIPVIIYGHTHKAATEQVDGTLLINPGTTGASGLRALQEEKQAMQLYTLSIIYVNSKSKRVTAIDSIQVTGLSGEFSLTRELIQQQE